MICLCGILFNKQNDSDFPVRIIVNINGAWQPRICLTPRDMPSQNSFKIIETKVKL